MPFPFDEYPWAKFEDLNIAYMIRRLGLIISEAQAKLEELNAWKTATEQDLENWKNSTMDLIAGWEHDFMAEVHQWEHDTEQNLDQWKNDVLAALNAWQTATTAAFEQIRVQAAGSASAAATSATAAETARAAAVNAQTAAEQAAAGVTAEAAQIQTNTDDIADLKNVIGTMPAFSINNLHDGFISSSTGKWAAIGNPSYKSAVIPVSGGELLKIDTTGLDGNAAIAALTGYTQPATGDTPEFSSMAGWDAVKVYAPDTAAYETLPADARYLYVYCGNPQLSRLPKTLLVDGYDYSKSVVDNIRNIISENETFKETLSEYKKIAVPLQRGYYWNSEQTTAVLTAYSSYSASEPIPASPDTKYHAIVYTGGSARSHAILCVDSNYNILSSHKKATGEQTYDFITPPDTAYILITKGSNDAEIVYYHVAELYELSYMDAEAIDNCFFGPYNGKYLSVLGDSISAYAGEIPPANQAYYTGNNAGVSKATQMWYNVVCRILNMKPLRINAWSGSCVTSGIRNDSTYPPASAASRCESLHSGSINPDVILIAMGINDYTYMSSQSQFGTWDGKTALGTAADMSDYANTTFRQAYATMLARIQKKYPNAKIFCITPFYSGRGSTDTGVTFLNTLGLTETDYSNAIKDIAEIFGVKIIDGSKMNFNRFNFYPEYAEDSSTTPTHPNANGHLVIGTEIAKSMLNN